MSTIVLFGVRGSGKDTVGHYLHNGHDFAPESFAFPLKMMVRYAFPFTAEDLFGPSSLRERQLPEFSMGPKCLKCDWALTPNRGHQDELPDPGKELICPNCAMTYPKRINARIALQTLGTEWGRRLYEDVWVDAAFDRIKNPENTAIRNLSDALRGTAPRHVITDGRYPNEQKRSAELGATTVLLLRKLEESTDSHTSESSLKLIPRKNFQYILDNRGPLEDLPGLIEKMLVDLGLVKS